MISAPGKRSLLQLVAAVVCVFRSAVLAGSCQCVLRSESDPTRQLIDYELSHQSKPRNVVFYPAYVRGEDYVRPLGGARSLDLSYNEHRSRKVLRKSFLDSEDEVVESDGDCTAEQVHLTLGNSLDSVIVSFTSSSLNTSALVYISASKSAIQSVVTGGESSEVTTFTGTRKTYSQLINVDSYLFDPPMGAPGSTEAYVVSLQNTSTWAKDPTTGEHYANYYNYASVQYGLADYNNPYVVYDSPVVFQIVLTNLKSELQYFYAVDGSCDIFNFTMPYYSSCNVLDANDDTTRIDDASETNGYPFMVGLTADLGQTNVSVASMEALVALNPAVILLPGDLSYADGWPDRWDSFARTFEFVASSFPVLTTGGNHEYSESEAWLSYSIRWPTPYEMSNSTNFCYWGREVGRMHVIALCSYAGTNTSSIQYQWLEQYLATSINRTYTPWVLVMMHAPWYNSNVDHWKESELMRDSMEELLYTYGVDIVLNGHVHSYERTHPVYQETVNECGPVHLNLGDGGNREGTYTEWKDAPSWTVFREASFGIGQLQLMNSTHAYYAWHRHACGSDQPGAEGMNFSDSCVTPGDDSEQAMLTSDVTWFTRPSIDSCPNRHMSTKTTSTVANQNDDDDDNSSSSNNGKNKDDDDNDELSDINISLIVLVVVLFFTNVAQALYWTGSLKIFGGFLGGAAAASSSTATASSPPQDDGTQNAMHADTEMTSFPNEVP